MRGNIGGNTCFCLYGSALWMYAMVPVKYESVGLWSRVAVWRFKRIELKEILLFFSNFGEKIPIFFPIFLATVIPIFLFS